MGTGDRQPGRLRSPGVGLSRRVYPFEPTWLDREYRKTFGAMSEDEQNEVKQTLTDLLTDLATCKHPCKCPSLAKWKPTPYPGVGVTALYEYRTESLSRVIVRCPDVAVDGEILLIAATLTHDHIRLRRLIEANRKALAKEPKPKPKEDPNPRSR